MSEKTDLVDYYAKRANEYERIYQKPERQKDLANLRKLFRQAFAGHSVLEIACGTGYWTQVVAETAKSITATDINDDVLQIARAKNYIYFGDGFSAVSHRCNRLGPPYFENTFDATKPCG